MNRVVFLLLMVFSGNTLIFGQLNNYKYVIVPKKFDIFKKENQYRTSTLVKYLFTQEGFNAVYEGAFPLDLEVEPCLGLWVNLIDESSLFITKTRLSLVDCNRKVVFETQEGKTKTKEFEQAYREAISEAFGSLRMLNYSYEPEVKEGNQAPITVSFKDDIKSLEEESNTNTTKTESKKTDETAVVGKNKPKVPVKGVKGNKLLYAQAIEDGFQLVDSTPSVVYILKSTSAPNVFLVSQAGKNGVVFKENGKWYIEFDEKGSKAKELNIKF